MTIINPASLAATVDAVNDALFFGHQLARTQRLSAARFIAERQGQPGAYSSLFAPLPGEPGKSLKLFTGETTSSWAGSAHILGQEAYRALVMLGAEDSKVQAAAERAAAGMEPRLADPQNAKRGMY
jgi:hypothetical protein